MTETETGQYRLLLKNLQSGVLIYTPDARIIFCNDEAERILGCSLPELVNLPSPDSRWYFMSETGLPLEPEKYPVNRILRHPEPFANLVAGIKCTDLPVTWVEINAYPEFNRENDISRIVVIFSDITTRIDVADNYRLKRYAFEKAMEGVLITEVKPNSAVIICANPEFTRNSGYCEQEIKGKDIRPLPDF